MRLSAASALSVLDLITSVVGLSNTIIGFLIQHTVNDAIFYVILLSGLAVFAYMAFMGTRAHRIGQWIEIWRPEYLKSSKSVFHSWEAEKQWMFSRLADHYRAMSVARLKYYIDRHYQRLGRTDEQ